MVLLLSVSKAWKVHLEVEANYDVRQNAWHNLHWAPFNLGMVTSFEVATSFEIVTFFEISNHVDCVIEVDGSGAGSSNCSCYHGFFAIAISVLA